MGPFASHPITNKILATAYNAAQELGHDVLFERLRTPREDLYVGTCAVCGATCKVISSIHKYKRSGTVFRVTCKPG